MPDRDSIVNDAIAQTWGKDALAPKDQDSAREAKPKPKPKPAKEAPRAKAPEKEALAAAPERAEEAEEGLVSENGGGPPDAEDPADRGGETEGVGDSDSEEPEHKKLLKAGKLKEAFLKAFGRPPSAFDVDEAKWQAHRKAKKQLEEDRQAALADVRARDNDLKNAADAVRNEYRDDHVLRQKAKTGDVVSTVELLCKQLNLEPKDLITAYVKGAKSIDRPLAKRLEQVEERLSRPAPAPAPAEVQGPTAEQIRAAEKRLDAELTTELEDHDIHRLKGYGTLVRQEMQAHYRKTKQRLDAGTAADRVLERRRKEREEESWLVNGDAAEKQTPATARPRRQLRDARPESEFTGSRDDRINGAIDKLFGRRSA